MNTKSGPTVSVVIATRNRPDRLRNALRSIEAQSFQGFEVIVVDDSSSAATIEQYAVYWKSLDKRFILLRNGQDSLGTGPADARNRGLAVASGEYVAFLDDDDEWIAQDHLQVGIRALKELDGDFFFGNMRGHRNGRIIRPDWFEATSFLKNVPRSVGSDVVYEVPLSQLIKTVQRLVIPPHVMIVQRELVQSFGGFLKHAWAYEDWNLSAHIADLSNKAIYRADVVAHAQFPEGDSTSASMSVSYMQLQQLLCAHEVRLTAQRSSIRRCARAVEGWVYRDLSRCSIEQKAGREAIWLAWQGLCVFPTLGAIASLAKAISFVLLSKLRG
jgi:hypothetical protein